MLLNVPAVLPSWFHRCENSMGPVDQRIDCHHVCVEGGYITRLTVVGALWHAPRCGNGVGRGGAVLQRAHVHALSKCPHLPRHPPTVHTGQLTNSLTAHSLSADRGVLAYQYRMALPDPNAPKPGQGPTPLTSKVGFMSIFCTRCWDKGT